MKYISVGIGYLIVWVGISLLLIPERIIKLLIIIIKICWYLKFKNEWLGILNSYLIIVPCPHPFIIIYCAWKVNTIKDCYLMKNYIELYKLI